MVYGATAFAQAKALVLEKRPDILVTEVQLHDYNGIHLVRWSRSRLPQLRSVVVGEPSSVLEKEAYAAGAAFLHPGEIGTIAEAVQEALASQNRPRKWPRNRLEQSVPVQIGNQPGHLLDVSYGGFRVETPSRVIADREVGFTLDIPEFGVRAQAKCMWMKRVGTSSRYWCGAALAPEESRAGEWRELVDVLVAQRR